MDQRPANTDPRAPDARTLEELKRYREGDHYPECYMCARLVSGAESNELSELAIAIAFDPSKPDDLELFHHSCFFLWIMRVRGDQTRHEKRAAEETEQAQKIAARLDFVSKQFTERSTSQGLSTRVL